MIWVEKFSLEHRGKICVRETGTIVFLHEIDAFWFLLSLPTPPKPLGGETGNRKQSPMHENSEFCLIIPRRDRSRIERIPSGFVSRRFHFNELVYNQEESYDCGEHSANVRGMTGKVQK